MRKSNEIAVAALMALTTCLGCIPMPTPRHPVMDVQVLQSDSTVVFKFHRPGRVAKAARVQVCMITPDGNTSRRTTIWEIVAEVPAAGVAEVTYGSLPREFVALIPERGDPPSLEAGVRYRVFAVGVDGSRGSVVFDLHQRSPGATP